MRKLANTLWGIVLVVIGVILTLNALEITNINIFFDGWWTLLIIIPSAIELIARENKFWSAVWLIIGILLLLACRDILDFDLIWRLTIPVLLILIGINLIFKDKIDRKMEKKNKELKDLHYGNYNPYNSTLELTRSSSGAIGALVCLKSLGIKGFQEIYINMFEGTYRIRELLSKEEGVCVLNNRSNGLVTFFIIKPARYKNLSIEEIIKLPLAEIEFIKKYNVDFSKFILNRAKNNLINFTFTSSRSYKYNGTNISLGALKIYPISVFFDKEEATKLVKNIINEIKKYKENTKNYENEISISDDMVYKERR